jgi:hypothetical protein
LEKKDRLKGAPIPIITLMMTDCKMLATIELCMTTAPAAASTLAPGPAMNNPIQSQAWLGASNDSRCCWTLIGG